MHKLRIGINWKIRGKMKRKALNHQYHQDKSTQHQDLKRHRMKGLETWQHFVHHKIYLSSRLRFLHLSSVKSYRIIFLILICQYFKKTQNIHKGILFRAQTYHFLSFLFVLLAFCTQKNPTSIKMEVYAFVQGKVLKIIFLILTRQYFKNTLNIHKGILFRA